MIVYAGNLNGFRQRHGASAENNNKIIALVSRLFFPRRPAHVVGLVVAVDITPIQSVLGGGTLAYVGKEGPKVLSPSSTDLNSSAAIIRKGSVTGALTALDHVKPYPVNPGLFAIACVAVAYSVRGKAPDTAA